MNVLLLSLPDYFEHMPPVAIRMPNGALTSLAGNVDPHHQLHNIVTRERAGGGEGRSGERGGTAHASTLGSAVQEPS